MTRNVGGMDRVARFAVGLVLLALTWVWPVAALGSGAAFWIATVVGVAMIVTALVRFCPLYPLIGVSTCRVR
ncbi:Protein of unknown function [Loktanella fryxellensis]|uniref:Inner membrane protein YgaP-like transmembrane domain-containing protein n=1 Tax=Loktanella fryxellensis TaxID=245187 RepID=A0A1H8EFJ2_9RHOB|nr:DUF2892 domain-containing protein [Loktanella fryxellensis]SEN18150.1 Protein of unknown function [Loktanella fryxellensis]